MMKDNAMQYEYLIRRAHQCGRHGVTGADADTYRRFERLSYSYFQHEKAIKEKSERLSTKNIEDMLADYLISAGEISAYIKTAVYLVMKKYDAKLNDEQNNELEDIGVLLITPNIEKVNQAIERAEKVMLEIGLFPQ